MRDIKYIAVHCTASLQTMTIAELNREFKLDILSPLKG